VARHYIDLVDLDHALKLHVRGLRAQAFAQGRRHRLGVILVQIQFAGDLAIGKIEAHEIQAQNPDAEGLMMAGQDRPAQIVEAGAATFAAIALPVLLHVVDAMAYDGRAGAAGTANAIGPTMLADQLKTLLVVDEGGKIDQFGRSQERTD